MTAATANELAEQVWDAVFGGRIPELGRLFADDAEMVTATSSGQGAEYIMGVFRRHHESYPDMKHELLTVTEGDAAACREVRFTGTHLGELRNPRTGGVIPPTGRTVDFIVCEVCRVKNGQIVSLRNYQDSAAIMRQLGLLS